jgi:hypothetical protein
MQQDQVIAMLTTPLTVPHMEDYMLGQQQHLPVRLVGTYQAMQNLLL